MNRWFTLCLIAAGLSGGVTEAAAQTWTTSGHVGVVSDYRWRGFSLSGEQPALQAEAGAAHASGVYGTVFASSVEDADGVPEAEVDYTLGWSGSAAGVDVDLSASAWTYPDDPELNYGQVSLWLSRQMGEVELAVGWEYAPAQDALGDVSDRYAGLTASWTPSAAPRWRLFAEVGRERGAFAPDGKTDWSAGAARSVGPVEVSLAWVGYDAPDDDDQTLVLALRRRF